MHKVCFSVCHVGSCQCFQPTIWEIEIQRVIIQGQPGQKDSTTINKPGLVVHAYHFSYVEELQSRSILDKNLRPYLKYNLKRKNGWRHGLSHREPTKKEPGLEFKPQYHQKE
jgi:hypothetical protein